MSPEGSAGGAGCHSVLGLGRFIRGRAGARFWLEGFAPALSSSLSLSHAIARAWMWIETNDTKGLPLQHLGVQRQSHKILPRSGNSILAR